MKKLPQYNPTIPVLDNCKIFYEAGKQEMLKEVEKLIDEEIVEEKEAMENKIKRMEWTILRELNFIKMKLKELFKG